MLGNGAALAPSNAQHRPVTKPRPRIGVDHVLIERNQPEIEIKNPKKNINFFNGLFGCGGRI